MKPIVSFHRSFLAAVLVSASALSSARAQSSPVPFDDALATAGWTTSAPVTTEATPNRAVSNGKPTLTVMGFESGTVSAQAGGKRRLWGVFGEKGDSERYEPSQLGIGIADLLIEKLLETGQFRVLESKASQPGSGAQFIVMGSVTKFGFEENNFGGMAANVATMGLLSFKQHKTEVTLTARVINAATGEIVASMNGEGVSRKGGGLRVAGIGGHGFGGVDVNSSNFRATAIGEATERAVSNLAERIVQLKTSF
jgi:curli biogenesis system outer membrane secretion channel CsgG